MQRRELILGAMGSAAGAVLGSPACAALPVPPSGALRFKVLRNGNPVGEQRLTFTQTGSDLHVDIDAAFKGPLMGGLFSFSYGIRATERWSAGAFAGLDSYVNMNGTPLEVHAAPIAGGFAIQSTKAGNYTYTGQPGMMPLSYWNKAMLDAMILNIDTGRHYPAVVTSPGWYKLPSADGGAILAQRFDITGRLHFSVWYDQYGAWAGLTFVIPVIGGQMLFQKYIA